MLLRNTYLNLVREKIGISSKFTNLQVGFLILRSSPEVGSLCVE